MLQLGESRTAVPQDPVREGNLDIAEARKAKCYDELERAVKHSSVTEKQYAAAPSTGLFLERPGQQLKRSMWIKQRHYVVPSWTWRKREFS